MMDVSVPISTRAAEVFKNFSQKSRIEKQDWKSNWISGVVKCVVVEVRGDYEMTSARVIC